MFAEARRTAIGNWEVFCTDCKKSVETMTGSTFNRAIIFALTRGGLKCPECRKNSCGRCHTYHGKSTLCKLCKLEVRGENKARYDFLN